MKKLILVLVFAVTAFAQRGQQHSGPTGHAASQSAPQRFNAPQQHFNTPSQRFNSSSNNSWSRFGQPPRFQPPMRRPPIVIQRPIMVRPYSTFGYYPWSTYYDWGYWPYYPWFYESNGMMLYRQPQPCKKETLRDSNGVKHDILVCIQSDGTTQITDANTLVPAPTK